MKTLLALLSIVLLVGLLPGAEVPATLRVGDVDTPEAETYMPHPHFSWERSGSDAEYVIEIARDEAFRDVVDRDRIAVVPRYVPRSALPAGTCYWRVRAIDSSGRESGWSKTEKLTVRFPETEFTVPLGATVKTVREILGRAVERSPAVVHFDPGEYRIDPDGAEALLPLVGASGLIVDGHGASITLTGQCNIVKLWDSQNVLVRNLVVDFDPLPYTAGRITAIDRKAGTFDIRIEPGHPDLNDNPKFLVEEKSLIYDARLPRLKEGLPILITTRTNFERLDERAWRISLAAPKQHKLLEIGDVYLNAPRGPSAFDVQNCRHVTFQGNKAYSTCGIGFSTHYASGLNLLDHAFRRKEGRFLAVQNGGTNIHNGRIGPWVEGCRFENTGDDCNHINSLVMYVLAQLDENRITLRSFRNQCPQAKLDLRIGDELSFFDRTRGHELIRRHIESIDYTGRNIEVTLDGPVPELRTNDQEDPTQVFNASRSCGQFVFRDNTFLRGRRLGILAKGHLGLIENNRFLELGGAGVDIWNAPYEGPNADTVLIQNNLFDRCGIAGNKQNQRWSIGTAVYRRDTADRWHRNLTIRGNHIIDSPTIAISLCDTQHVRVESNRIENRSLDTFRGDAPCAILLENTADAVLQDNQITDRRMESLVEPIREVGSERVRIEP
jgi:hypothetical protein